MGTNQTTTAIELSTDLVQRIESRLPQTEWDDPDAYITFVLEEVLSQVENRVEAGSDADGVDEDDVRDRLESLGYLNE
jgi:hypothetical protein